MNKRPPLAKKKNHLRRHPAMSSPLLGVKIIVMIIITMGAGFYYGRQVLRQHDNQVLGVSTKLSGATINQLLNLERAKNGLGALTLNPQLSAAAHDKGEYMIEHNYWAHVSPEGVEPWLFIQQQEYAYLSAGENLARDFNRESDLVAAWMASPTHRANVLNGNFSQMGLAVLDGVIDGKPVLLIVNFYAQPRTNQDETPLLAVYNQDNNAMVLAGEVLPQGTISPTSRSWLRWWEWAFVIIVVTGIALVLIRLQQKPYGRRRQRNSRKK